MIARSAAEASNPGRADSIVACTIGDEQFALRGADTCEIARAEVVRRSAGPDGAVGALYVGRERVSVYPLAAALGRRAAAGGGSQPGGNHVVVTRGAGRMIGWLIDRIARPALGEAAHVIPLPSIVGSPANRWFEGLVQIGDRSLLLLSPPHLDPRAPAPTSAPDDGLDAFAAAPAGLSDDAGSPLVLLFSSAAFPDCRATRFALSARRIAAVVRAQPVTVVPGSAPHVTGVIIWRGVAVPVIDSHLEADRSVAGQRDRLVVARCGGSLNGALVAFPIGADVTLHAPTRADHQVDDAGEAPHVVGVFDVGHDRVALLDLDAALECMSARHDDRRVEMRETRT